MRKTNKKQQQKKIRKKEQQQQQKTKKQNKQTRSCRHFCKIRVTDFEHFTGSDLLI
jgi:hypothetical protein